MSGVCGEEMRELFVPPWALPKEVFTVEEAAEFLELGKSTIYDLVGRFEIPHRRVGKTIRLSRSALVAWLAGSCKPPQE